MKEDEQPIEEEDIESQEGREQGVSSGGLDPAEAGFMQGFEEEVSEEEEDDYGLEDDEKIED